MLVPAEAVAVADTVVAAVATVVVAVVVTAEAAVTVATEAVTKYGHLINSVPYSPV